jgi:hypothetical protein
MDFRPLLRSSGDSAIDILPKTFDQSHRVIEFNVNDTLGSGGGASNCRVHGFIAQAFYDTKGLANSCGIIVGTRQDSTKGEILSFRPFSVGYDSYPPLPKPKHPNPSPGESFAELMALAPCLRLPQVSPGALAYMDSSEQGLIPPSQWHAAICD